MKGHKRTGLSVALSGSEDHLISREAGVFWRELGMSPLREHAVQAVRDGVEQGRLVWSRECIESLVEPWGDADVGALEEGQEVQELADDDDPLWDDVDPDVAVCDSTDEEDLAIELGEIADPEAPPDLIVPHPADDPGDLEEARRHAGRLATLNQLAALAQKSDLPALQWHINREKDKLAKRHQVGAGESAASAIVSRSLAEKRKAEEDRMLEVRAETRRKRSGISIVMSMSSVALPCLQLQLCDPVGLPCHCSGAWWPCLFSRSHRATLVAHLRYSTLLRFVSFAL